MVTKFFGTRVKRREDPRLITGTATYTDDLSSTGMLYAVFVRSPHAHARIRSVDLEAARVAPGVVAAFSGKDLEDKVNPLPTAWLLPDCNLKTPPHPALALDTVRYVGDGVAVIVAEDRYLAEDAVEHNSFMIKME
jgi:carbon-monoxide dehydrogenase large subunit